MDKKLSKAARRIRNEYVRNWRANHAEQVREANRRYWEKRAARLTSDQVVIDSTLKGGMSNECADHVNCP